MISVPWYEDRAENLLSVKIIGLVNVHLRYISGHLEERALIWELSRVDLSALRVLVALNKRLHPVCYQVTRMKQVIEVTDGW